jgi:uncharacterized protein YbaR (Trm112 family)/predicted nucleic-acid-binding Zn-ribbon protein
MGKTLKNKPCTKIIKNGLYCHNHQYQKDKIKIIDDVIPNNIDIHNDEYIIGDCSICLCDVDNDDDCRLVCGHRHHIECIKQIIKSECPVCRGPLVFNKDINIEVIKQRELKEMENKKIETFEQDQALAIELHGENNINNLPDFINNNINNHNNDFDHIILESIMLAENNDFDHIIQESIITAEIEEYYIMDEMLKYSYEFQQELKKSYVIETIYMKV